MDENSANVVLGHQCCHDTGGQFHLFPGAGESIGALAIHLDGREFGRGLLDIAHKTGE